MEPIPIEPIAWVRSTRSHTRDDGWAAETVTIELDARFDAEALTGIDTFSHVVVVFVMDRIDPATVEIGARHPRNDPALPKLGIFAQRASRRPNRLGVTVCRVVELDDRALRVAGLDAADGTPVVDLKPWMAVFGPQGRVTEPAWVAGMHATYWHADKPST